MIRLFTAATSFQQTVTTLSHHNQIITSTTTLLKHLKSLLPPTIIIFCCFKLNSTRNNFHWLTNYSHYIINSRLIWLHAFHFTHLYQPLKYTTLLHYSHIPIKYTWKKTSHTLSTSTPKYKLPQPLVLLVTISRVSISVL